MTGNAKTMAVRPALERRWDDALAAFDATHRDRGAGGAGPSRHGGGPQRAPARHGGVEPLRWYGVWLFVDWLEFSGAELDPDRRGRRWRPRPPSSSKPADGTPTASSAGSSIWWAARARPDGLTSAAGAGQGPGATGHRRRTEPGPPGPCSGNVPCSWGGHRTGTTGPGPRRGYSRANGSSGAADPTHRPSSPPRTRCWCPSPWCGPGASWPSPSPCPAVRTPAGALFTWCRSWPSASTCSSAGSWSSGGPGAGPATS